MRSTVRMSLLALVAGLALAAAGCKGNDGAETASGGPALHEIVPGLSYVDSTLGQGPEVKPDDFVVANYAGYLWVDGKKGQKFDSSYDRQEPIAFALGVGRIIPGWEKGVPGMHVGGKRGLLISPDLGFGPQGRPPQIPPNSTLWFDIEVVDVPKVEVQVQTKGTGPAAEPGDQISVDYTGYLWQDGKTGEKFDSSVDRGVPYKFTLGAGMVIPGWDKGLEGMTVGTKARLIIPPVMAYGKRGSPPKIPADATLCFDVDLVDIAGK